MPDRSEAQRRQSFLGIVLGAVVSLIGVGVGGAAWHDYRTLGNAPLELTVEQAVPSPETVPDETRWVNLHGELVFDCGVSIDHQPNGSMDERNYIAKHSSSERYFFITVNAAQACTLPQPVSGILKKADPGLPAWLKEKGAPAPESRYPLMDFEIGASAGSARTMLFTGAGCGFLELG